MIGAFVIIVTIWFLAIFISALIVKSNYKSALGVLAVVSPGFREAKLIKLFMSFPMYVIANHLLVLSLLPVKLIENGWGFKYILDNKFIINPLYLVYCFTALISSCIFGAIVISQKRDWSNKTYLNFVIA